MNYAIFKKPSRYIDSEVNVIRKEADIKIALCFPDTYEIGMSHIGLKILYSIINSIPYASAERVYAPWVDFESYLRQNNLPLTSLENQRPLRNFDIVGFTLQYELSYTNILNMLNLGGIPIKAEERGGDSPLIIAGGPCAVNPLPLVPFIDAFVIGDGEEVIKEVIEICREFKIQNSRFKTREELLEALSKIEGVYVPSVHDIDKQSVKKRIVEDLDNALFPDSPVVPFTSIVHDRVAIEISRGCSRGCRFCQAGMIYRPLRERSLENVLSLAQKSIKNTGYDEISFTSLSTGDYSGLLPLIRDFNRMCAGAHVSISLPSLRVGAIDRDILREIKSVRKTGFTIAPEAGTKRLRDVINKDFTEEEYKETLKKLFSEGWKNVKLYFMIGLPTETMTDIDGLIDMSIEALQKGREITGRRVNINVGISAFVPKPHTPFQWSGQDSIDQIREKQDYLKRAFKKRGINFKGQHVEHSLLEAVFSRADKDSAFLLEKAWELGCRFDGWSEFFNFDTWLLAAEKTGIDLYAYASRTFDLDQELPWDFVDTGIKKGFLKAEFRKALSGKITEDCRNVCCGCGLECKAVSHKQPAVSHEVSIAADRYQQADLPRITNHASRKKMRVRFSKRGNMRYLSHQELMTAIFRAIRRAQIPVAYSAGFHPHPKFSFGPALPAGVEGLNEFFDIELSAFIKPSDFLNRLNSTLPAGIEALSAALISAGEKALSNAISCYEYEIIIDKEVKKHINSFMSSQIWPVSRDSKDVDIRPMVEQAEIHDDRLHLILVDTESAKVRLYEVLREMLQKPAEEIQSIHVKRIGLYSYNKVNPVRRTGH